MKGYIPSIYLIGFPTSSLTMYGEHGLYLQWPLFPADVLRVITMVASAAKQALFAEWIDCTTPFTYFDGMEVLAESTRIPVGVPSTTSRRRGQVRVHRRRGNSG